jgi:hypothetical protein
MTMGRVAVVQLDALVGQPRFFYLDATGRFQAAWMG